MIRYIYINYLNAKGKPEQQWTPLKEVKGWSLPLEYKSFQGTENERDLFKIYGWPKITIKSRKQHSKPLNHSQ